MISQQPVDTPSTCSIQYKTLHKPSWKQATLKYNQQDKTISIFSKDSSKKPALVIACDGELSSVLTDSVLSVVTNAQMYSVQFPTKQEAKRIYSQLKVLLQKKKKLQKSQFYNFTDSLHEEPLHRYYFNLTKGIY